MSPPTANLSIFMRFILAIGSYFCLVSSAKCAVFYFRCRSFIVQEIVFSSWTEFWKKLIECANIFTSNFISLRLRRGVPSKTCSFVLIFHVTTCPYLYTNRWSRNVLARQFEVKSSNMWLLERVLTWNIGSFWTVTAAIVKYKGPIHDL